MIESNIVKRFIVKSFMQNSECDIGKIADITFTALSNRFMLNENVILSTQEMGGKIVKCSKESYLIQMADDSKAEVLFKDIKRKSSFVYKDVYSFIESFTSVTPLGRIVIENVFEKITQPGFGSRAAKVNDFEKVNLKGLQRRPEKLTKPPVSQSIEVRSHPNRTVKKTEVQETKLDLNAFTPFLVTGFEDEKLAILIKIYTFITAFRNETKVGNIKIEQLGESISDQEYNNELIVNLHKFFIEAIEKDIHTSGYRFVNDLHLCVGRLPDFTAEPLKDQKRKRIAIDIDNWKTQVKNFIYNFSLELGTDKLLRFLDITKKDSISLRVEFLDFLFKIFAYTDAFKSMVYGAVTATRMNKAIVDSKKGAEEPAEDSGEVNEKQINVLNNPMMANIGRFKDFVLFLSDRTLLLGDHFKFYSLDKKDANLVLRELNILTKTEKSTITNLRAIIGELFNSK